MAISYSLRAKHRDTFRLVPAGSTNPGDYVHTPTNSDGIAPLELTPQNYIVYVRPAYTAEFILLNSTIVEDYTYLRTMNPLIDVDGILPLALANKVLVVSLSSTNSNHPYVKANDTISIEVGIYASGIPAGELISPPTVSLLKESDSSIIDPSVTYLADEYNISLPHIYKYEYQFTTETPTGYVFKAASSEDNILDVDSEVVSFDTDPPVIDSTPIFITTTSASINAPEETVTASSTVMLVIPEGTITDVGSGVQAIYAQPFLQNNSTVNEGLKFQGVDVTYGPEFHIDQSLNWLDNGDDAIDLYIELETQYDPIVTYITRKDDFKIYVNEQGPWQSGNKYPYKIFKHAIDTDISTTWPSTFSASGNLVQTISLQQDLPAGFVQSSVQHEYGFLIAASDNCGNIQTDIGDLGFDTIQYDATLSLAPGLNYFFKDGTTMGSNDIYSNENNWYNSDTAYLVLQAFSEANPGGDPEFQVQFSYTGSTWTEASLVSDSSSIFYVPLTEGAHILQIRTYNLDGATSPIYTIEYKWDATEPVWNDPAPTLDDPVTGFNIVRVSWAGLPYDVDPDTGDDFVGLSGLYKIEIYRAVKDSSNATLDHYDGNPTNPSKRVGEVSPSDTTFTDRDFANYSDEGALLYLYWGVPVDIAGNFLAHTDAPLLCPLEGVVVEPLVPADVDGALRLEKSIVNFDTGEPAGSGEVPDTILARYGISSPVEALVIKTPEEQFGIGSITVTHAGTGYVVGNPWVSITGGGGSGATAEVNGVHGGLGGILGITVTDAGLGYTSIPTVTIQADLGGSGAVAEVDELESVSELIALTNIIYAGEDGDYAQNYVTDITDRGMAVMPIYIKPTSSASFIGNTLTGITTPSQLGSLNMPRLVKVAIDGEIYTSTTVPYGYLTVSSLGQSSISIGSGGGGLDSIDKTAFQVAIAAETLELGLLLEHANMYTFNMEPKQNKYSWKAQFNKDITNHLSPDDLNFNTILAADLIVGGTLRLETGLSIWSGEFEEGSPTGSGITMDTLGMTMFNNDMEQTVYLDATTGNFIFGNDINNLSFDVPSGKLTLLGKLSQISDELEGWPALTFSFIGDWDNSAAYDYNQGEVVSWNGSFWFWGPATAGNSTDATWNLSPTSGPRVPGYGEQYVAANGSGDLPWIVYASAGIEGPSAQDLVISAASQTITYNGDGYITTSDAVPITVSLQNLNAPIVFETEGIDLAGNTIASPFSLFTTTDVDVAVPAQVDEDDDGVADGQYTAYLRPGDFDGDGVNYSTALQTLKITGRTPGSEYSDSTTLHKLQEGTDSYSIILTNESHTEATGNDGTGGDWTDSRTFVNLYKGTTLLDCHIELAGITTSWSAQIEAGNDTTNPEVSLEDSAAASANDTGIVTIHVFDFDILDPEGTGYSALGNPPYDSVASYVGAKVFTVARAREGEAGLTEERRFYVHTSETLSQLETAGLWPSDNNPIVVAINPGGSLWIPSNGTNMPANQYWTADPDNTAINAALAAGTAINIWSTYANYQVSGEPVSSTWADPAVYSSFGATGAEGEAGAGVVFRGPWQDGISYYTNDASTPGRRDVVQGDNGTYYICTLAHTSSSSKEPPNVGYWDEFGATFSSVATALLLAEDATITKTLTIGQTGLLNHTLFTGLCDLHQNDVISGLNNNDLVPMMIWENSNGPTGNESDIYVDGSYLDIAIGPYGTTFYITAKKLLSYTDTSITLESGSTGPGSAGKEIHLLDITFYDEFGGIIQSADGTTGGRSYFTLDKDGITALKGEIGGIFLEENKLFTGTGTHGNSNTGFFLGSDSKFSLGDKLVWNPDTSNLEITGTINLTDGTPVGSGMNWIGAWNSSITYEVNDAVSYAGSSWIAVTQNSNSTPNTNNTNWNVLTEQGDDGAPGADGADGGQTVMDADMEQANTDYWGKNDTWLIVVAKSTAQKYTGSRSLKLNQLAATGNGYVYNKNSNGTSNWIEVYPGSSIDVKCYVRQMHNVTETPTGDDGLRIGFKLATQEDQTDGWVYPIDTRTDAMNIANHGIWIEYAGRYTIPATSMARKALLICLLSMSTSSSADFWIDNISVTCSSGLSLPVAPTGSGLFMGSNKMGFYNTSFSSANKWATFMNNDGDFYLRNNDSGGLSWVSSSGTLIIGNSAGGRITLDSSGNAYFSGDISSDATITGGTIQTTGGIVQLNTEESFAYDVAANSGNLSGNTISISPNSGSLHDGDDDVNYKVLGTIDGNEQLNGMITIAEDNDMKRKVDVQIDELGQGNFDNYIHLFWTKIGETDTYYFTFQTASVTATYRLKFTARDTSTSQDDENYGGS